MQRTKNSRSLCVLFRAGYQWLRDSDCPLNLLWHGAPYCWGVVQGTTSISCRACPSVSSLKNKSLTFLWRFLLSNGFVRFARCIDSYWVIIFASIGWQVMFSTQCAGVCLQVIWLLAMWASECSNWTYHVKPKRKTMFLWSLWWVLLHMFPWPS
jgi:hypothetical protein